jgi:hypothetical protein
VAGFDDESPTTRARRELAAWLRTVEKSCACVPLEVRIEGGVLECATCSRPIRPRRRRGG